MPRTTFSAPLRPVRPRPSLAAAVPPAWSGRACRLGLSGLLLLALMAVPQARADALRTLLGSLADGEEVALNETVAARAGTGAGAGAAAGPARGSRAQVVVRAGDSLDAVIRRTLGDSPFKEALLRRAFVDLNPQAFVNGQPHRLAAGAVLLVPGPQDVLALLDERSPASMGRPAGASELPGSGARHSPTAAEERRKWVRFP